MVRCRHKIKLLQKAQITVPIPSRRGGRQQEAVVSALAIRAELATMRSLATNRTSAGSPVKTTSMPIGATSDRHLLITPTLTCYRPNARSGSRKRETPRMFTSRSRTRWPRFSWVRKSWRLGEAAWQAVTSPHFRNARRREVASSTSTRQASHSPSDSSSSNSCSSSSSSSARNGEPPRRTTRPPR